jgi:O-antigen/teichoic acid export membrane protein|tara:strand:- start:2061 stop:3326 length:1266 start_codon:yes stop_codon:yes gene_type:complete
VNNIIQFIENFIKRSGSYVFTATVSSRLLSFFASWIALQLIPNKELGIVIYAFQIVSFIIPIAGFGLHQGLIRYGAQLNSIEEKNNLFVYTLKKGTLVSFILIGLVILSAVIFTFENQKTSLYLILLSFSILTHYLLELIKIQFRLLKNNKKYSYVELTYNILLVILVFVLSYYFKELGYAIAITLVPILVSLVFIKKLNINWKTSEKLSIVNFSFWKYGFFASLSNVTTQLLVSIDIILIGNILNNMELVTAFKYVTLIPFSLVFLSQVFMITDFVDFTEKINNKKYIYNYIKNYMLLFLTISIVCIGFLYFFGKYFLSIFDSNYIKYQKSLIVLTIGVSGILILRGLFGNLLSSIGKAHINFIITLIAVVLNIYLNYQLIHKYGIYGAAITSSIIMWFTGVLSLLFFFYYFKKIKTFDN